MTTDLEVKPTKPWKATSKERATTVASLLLALALAGVAVKTTGLAGKLGFAFSFLIFSTLFQVIVSVRKFGRKALGDSIATSFIYTGAIITFLPVASILFITLKNGIAGLRWNLFTTDMFNASFLDPIGNGGLLHALLGTLTLILIAMVISVPMGIMTALYLTEIKGKGSNLIQFVVQAMSGVPSVVAGLFIFTSVILLTPLKASAAAGGLALTVLMIPTVTRTAQEVLLLVPADLREAGLAMGATQWKTVATIVVPAARNGLITATILGVARIAGETAPLIFTIGGADKLNLNLFKDYTSAMPFYVWKGLTLGTPESIQRAWTGILILLIMVLALFTVARTLGGRRMK
ncbi:PstA ABC-type phosphate transport system, permease component [Candidatus Nanopelagicaceae bacterium]